MNEPQAPWARTLERIHAAVDHGDRRAARRILKALDPGVPAADLAFARYRVLALDDDLAPALAAAREGVQVAPESPDLHHAVGLTLLELGDAEGAIPHLEEACYLDADFADAWHDLALARESTGDLAGMRFAFESVWDLDFASPLPPLRWESRQLEEWAERTMGFLPPALRRAVANVVIFVVDHPERWIVEQEPWDPRLLGLFEGPTLAAERAGEGAGQKPHVYLFHRNLERAFPDAQGLAEQVRITLLHELGHYLGLDEGDLEERGLE